VGETTVVSRKVHTYDPRRPESLHIITNSDAGKVFYRRKKDHEVIHIDLFHSLGKVPARTVAEAVQAGVDHYARARAVDAGLNYNGSAAIYALTSYIDIQTGQGGGRATGKLVYGQKESLRKSHENHVHISAMLPNKDLALVFFLVESIERAVTKLGFELRKVERLVHELADPRTQQDMSAYSSYTDSFLKGERAGEEFSRDELYRHQLMDIADVLEELDSLGELQDMLHKAHPRFNRRGVEAPPEYPQFWNFQPKLSDAWNKLQGYGYVSRIGDRYALTEEGQNLYRFVSRCARQIECDLKQRIKWTGGTVSNSSRGLGGTRYSTGKNRKISVSTRRQDMEGSVALVPTVIESLKSSSLAGNPWRIAEGHLRYETAPVKTRLDVCLLIDASASMMGKRMKAAKALAEHLVHSTDDRLSVLVFQEDRVELAVPFTRNQKLLKAGLSSIKPAGLTPLATGLVKASEYVRQASAPSRALIVLITDGIPTMSYKSGDPMQESLSAAEDMGKRGINLCCVGLQPNQKLLDRLARAAGGSVHVVEEITARELMRIVESERKEVAKQ
jgi:magnesium chelatase subunit D